jgi:hypothetical protein
MRIIFRLFLVAIAVAVASLINLRPPKPKARPTSTSISNSTTTPAVSRDEVVKRWVSDNLPRDRAAELVGLGAERNLWNGSYQVGWVRSRNSHEVTVMTNFVFEFAGNDAVVKGWSSREFVNLRRFELESTDPSLKGQRAMELQRFCDVLGIPIEKDL